jgi:DNA-binding IclR family transcriptional regulator
MGEEGGVKSAIRVFEILEVFREQRRPLRMKDVVDRLGYPASSMAGLLKTMVASGYLAFDATARTYQPSSRLVQLVSWIPGVAFEGGVVAQALRNVARATGELVVLGALDDVAVEYVEALRSRHGIQLWTPPGTRQSVVRLGLGWMFLARCLAPGEAAIENRELLRIYRRSVALGMIDEIALPLEAVAQRVEAVRGEPCVSTDERSYPTGMHPGHPGGGMVWIVLPVPPGHRQLGVGIGGPAARLAENLPQYRAALLHELEMVSEALAQSVMAGGGSPEG